MRLAIYNGSDWQKKHAKEFGLWYVEKYIPSHIHDKLNVSVTLYASQKKWESVASDKKDLGYCDYIEEDRQLGVEHCKITLYSPRNLLYYRFMVRLVHEFVHVKQYVTHELKDYSNCTSFKKQKFKEDIVYWDMPWEIEAMGHEYGLVKLYCEHANIKKEVFTTRVKRIIC